MFDRLPEDLRKAVLSAAASATKAQRATAAADAKAVLAKLEASGMKVNAVKDIKPFRESVQGVYEQFKPTIGPDLLQETLTAVQ